MKHVYGSALLAMTAFLARKTPPGVADLSDLKKDLDFEA